MSPSVEVQDLTSTLDRQRELLLKTAEGLTDEQARTRSTASELTVASILKHVADTEEEWFAFAEHGAPESDGGGWDPDAPDLRFVLSDDDTLDHLRERVRSVGRHTTELLQRLDLDQAHALPEAPWFEPGEAWTVRHVAAYMIAEMAQHTGHADIIRETIDGAKSMG